MPGDEYTDQTERMIAEEIVREKIFLTMRQEIPFSTAVQVEQFVEERAEVDHGLPQTFGGRLPVAVAYDDRSGGAIVLYDSRVADGDICGSLLKVSHGVAACGHHVCYQLIGLPDCQRRVVDELLLHLRPFQDVSFPIITS